MSVGLGECERSRKRGVRKLLHIPIRWKGVLRDL